MTLISLLNLLVNYKGFVATSDKLFQDQSGEKRIEVYYRPRKGSKGKCPQCGRPCPTYDTSPKARHFEFVPIFMIPVFFVYHMRRVQCPVHGVKTEQVPWSDGKSDLTKTYSQFLANWARRLSYSEVASYFHTSYGKVFRSVQSLVEWGLKHRELEGIKSIGVDEICYRIGRTFMTLVYQIDDGCVRLLHATTERKEKSLISFFAMLNCGRVGKNKRSNKIEFVCSDMWRPYLNVISKWCVEAVHILDRFHIKKQLNKAVDQVRRDSITRLRKLGKGQELQLRGSKYLFLKNKENLTAHQTLRLRDLLKINLPIVRAYLQKLDFDRFWEYSHPYWALKFLKKWNTRVMRSKLEPMKSFVRMLRNHESLIMNWFRCKGLSNGIVEGLNNKAKTVIKKSYGFRTAEGLKIALYHSLGNLPEPEVTHRFW